MIRKIVLILGVMVLLVGCGGNQNSGQEGGDGGEIERLEGSDVSGGSNENGSGNEGEGLMSEVGCTEDNPPRLAEGKAGMIFNYCGKETDYRAFKLEGHDVILYEWTDFNEEKGENEYMIKSVSTKEPFEEKDLAKSSFPEGPFKYEDIYFWGTFSSGPGEFQNVFAYKPDSGEFISAASIISDGKKAVVFFGSEAAETALIEDAELEKAVPWGESCLLPEISMNGIGSVYDKDLYEIWRDVFPKKIPCMGGNRINVQTGELNPPAGYFDLKTGRFVRS